MTVILEHWPQVVAAYLVYLFAVLSPGPATMAIASASLGQGRRHGLTIAAGIFCGSMTWAIAAALGLAAILSQYAQALILMRILGGLYLLYLAWRAFRSAASRIDPLRISKATASLKRTFLMGYAIHLTNPKAIFAWLAIISLGLPADATPLAVAIIVCGCLATGFTIFMGYALLFSTSGALRIYRAARRYIDGTLAVLFTLAGVKLLTFR
ncbi:LysE family translocator [Rhizobium sp. 'Codium 1']|uniref:LysE family translocator n=1 Tax=Rhizobium sp. 'Codium 1' TaxID=2940484 RepID=UPI001E572C62|nr:LysE family translocator [Rhizobium sp. 'Codium 1']MCC8933044.1 LysE family translocator [Rhizobium sp. 'Codium 1']